MISLTIDSKQIDALRDALKDKAHRIPRHMATAVNATARKVRSVVAKEIGKELAVTQKVIKESIKDKSKATKENPTAVIQLKKTERIPLRDFQARPIKQTKKKKGGVTYRISKSAGRRSIERNAFFIERFGNHVFSRVGSERGPLRKLMGPTPWGVYLKKNLDRTVREIARDELNKQMQRQIRQVLLGYSKYDKK